MEINQDCVWVPVNVRGFRLAFEMNGSGFVRHRDGGGQGRWLYPQRGVLHDQGEGYVLTFAGREAWLPLEDAFAVKSDQGFEDDQWIQRACRVVDKQNRQLEERARLRDPLGTMLQEAEGDSLLALLNTLARGCPWERSRIGGDARGADPVLGF